MKRLGKLPKHRDKQNNLSETKEKLGELESFSERWLKQDPPGWTFNPKSMQPGSTTSVM
jgi:hypothetical protein